MFRQEKAHVPQKQIDSLIGSAKPRSKGTSISPVGCALTVASRPTSTQLAMTIHPRHQRKRPVLRVKQGFAVVVIDGAVEGPVHATEYLELLPNARDYRGRQLPYAGDAGWRSDRRATVAHSGGLGGMLLS